jgi:hemerythrin
MRSLKWSTSQAVFVTEIDDEHKEIFQAVSNLQKVCTSGGSLLEIGKLTERLTSCIAGHFAHEERLMRAARYGSIRWHKTAHDNARRRVGQFVVLIEQGDTRARLELVEYLTSWLTIIPAWRTECWGPFFLRNHQRCTLTFRAGTKPLDSCSWVTVNGDAFNPETTGQCS